MFNKKIPQKKHFQMNHHLRRQLYTIFKEYPEIKLVYFYGSKAAESDGPLSDYDFAVYLDTKDIKKMYTIKFQLLDKISRLLKIDTIDITILNLTNAPEFKYQVITQGELLYELEPYRVLIEPQILNEYFDFYQQLKRHGLTKA